MDRASVYGTEEQNPQPTENPKTYENGNPCACQNLCQNAAKNTPETGLAIPGEDTPGTVPPDPELASLIDAWPTLPEPVKAGILAMVNAVKQ